MCLAIDSTLNSRSSEAARKINVFTQPILILSFFIFHSLTVSCRSHNVRMLTFAHEPSTTGLGRARFRSLTCERKKVCINFTFIHSLFIVGSIDSLVCLSHIKNYILLKEKTFFWNSIISQTINCSSLPRNFKLIISLDSLSLITKETLSRRNNIFTWNSNFHQLFIFYLFISFQFFTAIAD